MKKVLLVDDTVMTGRSMTSAKEVAKKNFKSFVTSAIYVNQESSFKPDIWAVDLPAPHILEWNIFNSFFSPNIITDFDGILCNDCLPEEDDDGEKYLNFIKNASPLFLPRRSAVQAIVTARIEKYRKDTEIWLAKYGVKYEKLIMHPAKSLKERNQCDISRYKADAAMKLSENKDKIFFESDNNQAQAISRYLGGNICVICPQTNMVY
jgi:uncharacterized HAD superfamily protein